MNPWMQLAVALQTIRSIDESIGLGSLGLSTGDAMLLKKAVDNAQETMGQQQKNIPIDLAFELGLEV